MEKLTIKELAPYLPYGLKGVEYIGAEPHTLTEIKSDNTKYNRFIWENDVRRNSSRIDCKPLLKRIESINISNIDKLTKSLNWNYSPLMMVEDILYFGKDINKCPYNVFIVLLENHYDVFNLIEIGLAIDINTIQQ